MQSKDFLNLSYKERLSYVTERIPALEGFMTLAELGEYQDEKLSDRLERHLDSVILSNLQPAHSAPLDELCHLISFLTQIKGELRDAGL